MKNTVTRRCSCQWPNCVLWSWFLFTLFALHKVQCHL